MPTINWSAIYLGKMADLDTNESTLAGEGAAALLTTFGSAGAPLSDNVVTLQTDSSDGDSSIGRDNDGTTDSITYETTPGGPTQTSTLDSIYQVNISYDFAGGGGSGGGSYFIVQDDAGQLFLLAPDSAFQWAGAGNAPFESLTVNSVVVDDMQTLSQSSADGGTFVSTSAGPTICFLPDTHIKTPMGEVEAGNLQIGDLVSTLDHGAQPILWIGCKKMNFQAGEEEFKPYRIKKGALGDGLPRRNLKLSKHHKLLLRTGNVEHLGPAVGFLPLNGVSRMNGVTNATFMTFLLPHHEIIFAEGTPIESFYLGENGLKLLSKQERDQIKQAQDPLALRLVQHLPVRPFLSRRQTVDALQCLCG